MTAYAIFPSGVAECSRCGCDVTEANIGGMIRVRDLAPNASACIVFCQSCAEAIDNERASATRQTKNPPIELEPRTARNAGRRHPAYGAALTADPPPADEHLRVLVGWEHADAVPDPKLIVRPADNPARLRFDVAAGRTVRVYHPHTADPNRLFSLAQNLIDYGAAEVELVIHPPRPEAHGTELLRIMPKGRA